jgi:hypothetical protein
VNVVAFLVLGTIALSADLGNFLQGANASENSLFTFMIGTPIWIAGTVFALRVVRRRSPSTAKSLVRGTQGALALAAMALPFVIMYGGVGFFEPMVTFDNSPSRAFQALKVALVPFAIPVAYCCFITFGLINGYFGFYFSLFNVGLLLLKLQGGERIDAVLWFNLLGLVEIQSAPIQWALLSATIALGLSERTFRILEGDQ